MSRPQQASAADVTSRESFEHVEEWLSEVDRYANENTSKLLVGNKADLATQKQVPEEEAQRFAEKLGIAFLETSAKTATNVETAFLTMAKELIQSKQEEQSARQTQANLKLQDGPLGEQSHVDRGVRPTPKPERRPLGHLLAEVFEEVTHLVHALRDGRSRRTRELQQRGAVLELPVAEDVVKQTVRDGVHH